MTGLSDIIAKSDMIRRNVLSWTEFVCDLTVPLLIFTDLRIQ